MEPRENVRGQRERELCGLILGLEEVGLFSRGCSSGLRGPGVSFFERTNFDIETRDQDVLKTGTDLNFDTETRDHDPDFHVEISAFRREHEVVALGGQEEAPAFDVEVQASRVEPEVMAFERQEEASMWSKKGGLESRRWCPAWGAVC